MTIVQRVPLTIGWIVARFDLLDFLEQMPVGRCQRKDDIDIPIVILIGEIIVRFVGAVQDQRQFIFALLEHLSKQQTNSIGNDARNRTYLSLNDHLQNIGRDLQRRVVAGRRLTHAASDIHDQRQRFLQTTP